MSDFFSSGWSLFIALSTLVSLFACLVLLGPHRIGRARRVERLTLAHLARDVLPRASRRQVKPGLGISRQAVAEIGVSAQRIAFHLLTADAEEITRLADALVQIREKVRFCEVCGNVAEAERCRICLDPRRDPALICVVEQSQDVAAIERTREFRGRYHVLGGAINPMAGVVEGFRWALLGTPPPGPLLAVSTAGAAALLVGGAFYFRRVERTFADTV